MIKDLNFSSYSQNGSNIWIIVFGLLLPAVDGNGIFH